MKKNCENLRLLLVGPYPPPYGGIASHLVTLIPSLHQRGAADIAIVSFGDQDEVVALEGAILYRFNAKRHLKALFSIQGMRFLMASIKTLKSGKFGFLKTVGEAIRSLLINKVAELHASNVVSFYQSDSSLSLLPCMDKWNNARGVVLMIFGEIYDSPETFINRKAFYEQYLASPHSVISSSKHCACSFKKILGIPRPVEHIYLGIDLERFSREELRESFRAELGVGAEKTLVLYMGRFNAEMGLNRLLEIGPSLLARLPNISLLLCGAKGPLTAEAIAFAEKYVGRVHVLNDVPSTLQPAIYAASDIVLAPSHDQHACMGMSIKEAMAASKPVIGTDSAGIPEAIVHNETGFLVPLDKQTKGVNLDELFRYIDLLVSDVNLRESMGVAARTRAETIFSMDRTNDRMSELFMEAISLTQTHQVAG